MDNVDLTKAKYQELQATIETNNSSIVSLI